MKSSIKYFLLVLIYGCSHEDSRYLYSQFMARTKYIPQSVSAISGHYATTSMFQADGFEVRNDSTFTYWERSDVIVMDDPTLSVNGRYYLSGDSIAFVFTQYQFRESASATQITAFQNSIISKIRLVKLSAYYSPCIVRKVDDNILLFRIPQLEDLRRDFQSFEKITKTVTLPNGRKSSPYTLMKIDDRETK